VLPPVADPTRTAPFGGPAPAPVAPAPRTPVSPAYGPVTPAIGRAAVPPTVDPGPDIDAELDRPVPPPVAARTILPTREKGLLRRRSVPPVEPPAPQAPRHALPPTLRPAGAPMHSEPSAPASPAPTPVRMPAPPVRSAPPAPAVPLAPSAPPVSAAPAAAPVGLPSRAPRHEAAPGPVPVDAVASELSPLAQLSQLASASYTPELVSPAEPAPLPTQRTQPDTEPIALARRQPAVKPVGAVEEDAEQPIRPRAAGDVRSMLSGFRAGVQRGRDGSHTTRPAHGVDNLRRD
jgi:hypothetical protein